MRVERDGEASEDDSSPGSKRSSRSGSEERNAKRVKEAEGEEEEHEYHPKETEEDEAETEKEEDEDENEEEEEEEEEADSGPAGGVTPVPTAVPPSMQVAPFGVNRPPRFVNGPNPLPGLGWVDYHQREPNVHREDQCVFCSANAVQNDTKEELRSIVDTMHESIATKSVAPRTLCQAVYDNYYKLRDSNPYIFIARFIDKEKNPRGLPSISMGVVQLHINYRINQDIPMQQDRNRQTAEALRDYLASTLVRVEGPLEYVPEKACKSLIETIKILEAIYKDRALMARQSANNHKNV